METDEYAIGVYFLASRALVKRSRLGEVCNFDFAK